MRASDIVKTRFVGIDPGSSSGGIAVIENSLTVNGLLKLKDATDKDVLMFLNGCSGTFGLLERVHSMPRQGVASTFAFGASFGGLRMALSAAGIPFELVTPAKWMRALGVLKAGKNGLKARAQQLFPGVRVTLWNADALLLAYYAKRLWEKGE